MNFLDIDINTEYRSGKNEVVKDFYIPLLSEAVMYKRAVGFFSSSSLIQISYGISKMIKNGGRIELIVSPRLSEEDVEAMKIGYKQRMEIIENAIIKSWSEPQNIYEIERLNLMAHLIAEQKLDIKVAFTEDKKGIGMYHEKMGLVYDGENNIIAFSGSTNETGMAFTVNYEVIDVYCSWKTEFEENKVKEKEIAFEKLWNDKDVAVKVIDFPDVAISKLLSYKKDYVDYAIEENEFAAISVIEEANEEESIYKFKKRVMDNFFIIPDRLKLYNYQNEAIENWLGNGACGIYDMATGSGKTYTALSSIAQLSKKLDDNMGVVIVAPYQHLVDQWVEDIEFFGVRPIVAYSSSGINWKRLFADVVNSYNVGVAKNFCIISTNATFATEKFQQILSKIKKNLCFVVDEAHNIGAEKSCELLPINAKYRLALSATIERHNDSEGTQKLRDYFGEVCQSFTIKDAIQREFLAPYYYHPVIVYLTLEELEEYNEITKLITKNSYLAKSNKKSTNLKFLEMLLIKRARIVAGAREKVDKLIDIMAQYKDDNYILIYCGATKYDNPDVDDESEIRQIDEINKRLFSEHNIKVRKFTSTESVQDRIDIKEMFIKKELQVITAIKCLDEGVNIPAIRTAFILASSTNPKEHIQRRGRVLRKYPGKEYARIYDFITLPRRLEDVKLCNGEERQFDLTLIDKELNRMMEFAETALNPYEIDSLKEAILEEYCKNRLQK